MKFDFIWLGGKLRNCSRANLIKIQGLCSRGVSNKKDLKKNEYRYIRTAYPKQ